MSSHHPYSLFEPLCSVMKGLQGAGQVVARLVSDQVAKVRNTVAYTTCRLPSLRDYASVVGQVNWTAVQSLLPL